MKKIKLFSALGVTVLLAACGGGGGGSTAGGGSTNLAVDGTASKGLLSGAQVQAYQYDASNVKSKFGESVKTDANGKYTLSLPASSKPVVIEITSITGTKMLDETTIVGGSFHSLDAPSALVIRTGVSSLTASVTVHANVYTEAAVNAALTARDNSGNAVALSSDVFDAAKGAIRAALPAGVNPFTIRGINANDSAPTDNEKTLITLFAGVAKDGKDSANSCTGDTTTGMTCAIARVNDSSKIKVDTSNKATFADPTLQQTVNQNVINKAKTVDNAFVNTVKTTLSDAVKITEAIDPVTVAAQDSLSAFIKSMRDGFKATETTLQTAVEDFTQRTKSLSAVAEYTGGGDLVSALKGCQTIDSTLLCVNTVAPEAVIYTAASNGGYGYSYYSTLNGRKFKVSGTITASIDTLNKGVAFSVLANRVLVNSDNVTQKKVSDSVFTVSILMHSDVTSSSCTDCTGSITLSAKVYDNDDQSKYVSLSLNNGSAIYTITNGITTKAALSGGLTLSSSDGDNISGTLEAAGETVRGGTNQQAQLKSLNLSFSGRLSSTTVASGSFIVSRDYSSYDPAVNYSSTNLPKDNVSLNLALAGSTGITVRLSPSATDLTKRTVTLIINGDIANYVTMSQPQQFTQRYGNGDWYALAESKTTLTSSSGDFTAQLDDADSSFTGALMKGSTQIGQITNNVIYVNGQEISLY